MSLEAARGFDVVLAGREAMLIPQMNCDRQNRQKAWRFQSFTDDIKQFCQIGPNS
jgi:hypothetical protein